MEEQRRGTNSRFEEFDVCWKVFWKVPRELFFWLALGKMWLSNISDIVRASTIFKLLGMMLHSLCLSLDITFHFSPHSHFLTFTFSLSPSDTFTFPISLSWEFYDFFPLHMRSHVFFSPYFYFLNFSELFWEDEWWCTLLALSDIRLHFWPGSHVQAAASRWLIKISTGQTLKFSFSQLHSCIDWNWEKRVPFKVFWLQCVAMQVYYFVKLGD